MKGFLPGWMLFQKLLVMQVTNATTDSDDDDDVEVEGNSMGNQGWSDMILPTITNTASHRVLSNKQRVIVPP